MPDLTRRSFGVPGLGHGDNPVPVAARVGGLIATGGIRGVNRETGQMPEDVAGQARLMVANLIAAVEAAGGSADTILKVTIHLKSAETRSEINPAWVECFPDPDRRPSRQVLIYADLAGKVRVQCDALAVALKETTA